MTATLEGMAKKKQLEQSAEQQAATELVRQAREQGLSLTGPDGLLKQLTKTVLETALSQELTEHLGHEKNGPPGSGAGLPACAPRLCVRAMARHSATFAAAGHDRPPWQRPSAPGHDACHRSACRGPEPARPSPSRL